MPAVFHVHCLNRRGLSEGSTDWEDGAMGRRSRFSPEVRERAVRLVKESIEEHSSKYAAICSVAAKLGRGRSL